MQFAKTTNYAMSLVYYLAAEGQICNTVQLSTSLGIPPSYVPKVIRLLKQAGLIDAVKGSRGGTVWPSRLKALRCWKFSAVRKKV